MSLKVNNQDMNRAYQYNNPNNKVNKSKSISFEDQFDKVNHSKGTNNTTDCCNTSQIQTVGALSYSPTGKINNISKLSDEQQTLIEDQKSYDKFELKNEGIEFNSEEFKTWKKENTKNVFPPLDAPWQVRRTFRQMEESVASDPVAKDKLDSLELHLHAIMCHPEKFDYPKDLDFSNPDSYSKLMDLIVKDLKSIYTVEPNKSLLDDVNMLSNINEKLKKYL